MDTLLIAGGVVVAYFLLTKIQALNNLRFTVTGVSYDFSDITFPIIYLDVLVENPTPGKLTFNSLVGNFSINGNPTGTVSYIPPVPLTVEPLSQSTLQLTLRVSGAALIQDLFNYVTNHQGSLNITVVGTANVEGINAPVTLSINP